ncbi:MAG TPA: hypothetical protein VGL23_16615 [Chloroflexota bacterium]
MPAVTRRRMMRLALTSAGGLLLAACGQAAPTPAPPKPVDTGAPKPAAETPKPAAEPPKPAAEARPEGTRPAAAAKPDEAAKPTIAPAARPAQGRFSGTIVVSIHNYVPDEAQPALASAYKQARPEVQVIWELPATTTANYTTWLGTQLAAGTIRPDVVSGNYFPSFARYFNFDQVRKNINPHTGRPWDQDLDWEFYRGRNAKGERSMLPTRAVHTMYFYNKELLAKAKAKPPLNWSELIDTCRTLKAAGITPIAANWLFQVPQWIAEIHFDQYHVDWAQVARAQKGDWNYEPAVDDKFVFDAKDPLIHGRYTYSVQRFFRGLRDGTIKYDNPGMAEMIKNLAEIFPKYATSDMFVLDDSYPPFLQQQVAIMSAHTGSIPTLNNDMKAMTPDRLKELKLDEKSAIRPFEWGFFENPHMEGPLVKTTAKAVESAVGEYVSIVDKDQRQTELTLDFVMFWLSKAGYQPFLEGAAKAGLRFRPSGPLMVKDVKDPPEIQKGFADVKFVGNAEANYNNFLNWGGAASPHRETARNLYKEALEGKMPPSDYGKRLDALIKANFDDIVKRTLLTKEDIDNPAKQPGT